ncbi:MAG: AAA family ATPase [Thermoplasmatales archaeon]|jgi:predicted ATP-dependent endonuclease of OLD family|nr:AAA family ATPase [Thermoplasmatales archaeon]
MVVLKKAMDTLLTLKVKGLEGFAESPEIPVSPGINIFVGKNSVGKTRLLKFVNNLKTFGTINWDALYLSTSEAETKYSITVIDLTRDRNAAVQMTIEGSNGNTSRFSISRGQDNNYEYNNLTQGALLNFPQRPVVQNTLGSVFAARKRISNDNSFENTLQKVIYIDSQRVIKARVQAEPKRIPSPDGSDLGQSILWHKGNETSQYQELAKTMKNIFPEIESVLAIPVETHTTPPQASFIDVGVKDKFTGKNIPANEFGTGVSQVLFFVSMILFSEPGRIFLVDEPHVYLHPSAEKSLANFIRSHSEHAYLIATHSPIMIRSLKPDRILLLTRDEGGIKMKEILSSEKDTSEMFSEIGLTTDDLSLSNGIVFVEGTSDSSVYKVLFEKIGDPIYKFNYNVLDIGGSSKRSPLTKFYSLVKDYLPRHLIVLDGDSKGDWKQDDGQVRYLPTSDIEELLLKEPESVYKGISHYLEVYNSEGLQIWNKSWTGQMVSSYVEKLRKEHGEKIKGKEILDRLFSEAKIGDFTNSKVNYYISVEIPEKSDILNIVNKLVSTFFEEIK